MKETKEQKYIRIQNQEKRYNLSMMLKAGTITQAYYNKKVKDLK